MAKHAGQLFKYLGIQTILCTVKAVMFGSFFINNKTAVFQVDYAGGAFTFAKAFIIHDLFCTASRLMEQALAAAE